MCGISKKFREWKKWYSENELSICAQINLMIIDAAVFHTINEAKKYASTDANGNPELNWMVHDLIDRTFLGTQALSIRRLCDKRDDVISLRRLINSMKVNVKLLTRENILSALGFPYDYNKAREKGLQTQNPRMRDNGAHSENVHKNIDLLSGVEPSQRQPNDTVKDDLFRRLNDCLDKCEPITKFVNKTVAHSATEQSKGKVPYKDLKISLAKIHKAHCRIVRTTAFIGQFILYESSGWGNFLPSVAGDKFEHFDKPWVKQGDITNLEDFWSQYEKHIERLNKNPERILKKKNNP